MHRFMGRGSCDENHSEDLAVLGGEHSCEPLCHFTLQERESKLRTTMREKMDASQRRFMDGWHACVNGRWMVGHAFAAVLFSEDTFNVFWRPRCNFSNWLLRSSTWTCGHQFEASQVLSKSKDLCAKEDAFKGRGTAIPLLTDVIFLLLFRRLLS